GGNSCAQQSKSSWLWNRGTRRAFDDEVVDSVVSRRRRCPTEDDAKCCIWVVVQTRDACQVKHYRDGPEGDERSKGRPKVDEGYAVEAILELIIVESRSGSLCCKADNDVRETERTDENSNVAAIIGITGTALK